MFILYTTGPTLNTYSTKFYLEEIGYKNWNASYLAKYSGCWNLLKYSSAIQHSKVEARINIRVCLFEEMILHSVNFSFLQWRNSAFPPLLWLCLFCINLKNSAHIPQTEIMDVLEITNAHLAFQNSKFLVFCHSITRHTIQKFIKASGQIKNFWRIRYHPYTWCWNFLSIK